MSQQPERNKLIIVDRGKVQAPLPAKNFIQPEKRAQPKSTEKPKKRSYLNKKPPQVPRTRSYGAPADDTSERVPHVARQITIFCLICIAAIALNSLGDDMVSTALSNISKTVRYTIDINEDIGKLVFLRSNGAVETISDNIITIQKPSSDAILLTYEDTGRGIQYASDGQVRAAMDGQVFFIGTSSTWGEYIRVHHAGGWDTIYANTVASVEVGESVLAGQKIGDVCEGSKLYFELWKDGLTVDPLLYFPQT